MPNRLFVVHGSHPCETVRRALALKGVEAREVELPPPGHMPVMRALFGRRTVPGLRFADGEKVQGSTVILRRLEEQVPEPPLYPAARRAEVEEAERWGDEVLQPLVRRVLWVALQARPEGVHAMQAGQRTPALPLAVVKVLTPALAAVERRVNGATDVAVRADLLALAGHLNRVAGWLADGLLGGASPTAADLQIAPSLRLLLEIADLGPLLRAHGDVAAYAERDGGPVVPRVPGGAYPAGWVPSA